MTDPDRSKFEGKWRFHFSAYSDWCFPVLGFSQGRFPTKEEWTLQGMLCVVNN